jgi:uncharacterized Zn-finger protein
MTIKRYSILCDKCKKRFTSNSRYYVNVEGYPFEVNSFHKKCAEKEEKDQMEILCTRERIMKENPELKRERFLHPKIFVEIHTYRGIFAFMEVKGKTNE